MSSPGPSLREVARPVSFGVFEFHLDTLELRRSGNPVRLQELPARLLAALLRQPGELITREQLQTELWPSNTFVQFDAGLNTAMNKLRLALRDSADNPQFIETVPRTGYRFIAPVRRLEAPPVTTLQPLEQLVAEPAEAAPSTPPAPRRKVWLWAAVAGAVLCAGAVGWLLVRTGRHAGYGPTVRFAIDLPPGQKFQFYSGRQIAISPDGATLAWIAVSGGVRQIYARKLAENTFRPLPGTARAGSLCFSPSSDWVSYIDAAGEVHKASVDGRWNIKLAALGPRSQDGTLLWGSDGWIYFSATDYPPSESQDSRKIYRIRQDGGKPEEVMPGPQPAGAWYPQQLLPYGLLCTTDYAPSDLAINYLPFGGPARQLVGHASGPRYLSGGYLIFDRSSNVMAVPFDAERLKVKGAPVMVLPDVAPDRYAGLQMDVSTTGTLVYFRSTLVHERQPVWVDKEGRETPSGLPAGRYRLLDLSPDGERLLLTRFDAGDHWTISSYRLTDHSWKEILSDDSPGSGAIWSPDGKSIAIAARYQREQFDTLYLKPLDGSGGERPLLGDAYSGKYAQSWSRAANAIAYTEGYHEKTKRDIYVLPMAPGAQPQCVVCTTEDDVFPSFSPDGRWLTYSSTMGGQFEVYVQRYPGPFQPIRISTDGGRDSLWAPSGREIYYGSGPTMWAVAFDPATGKPGRHRKLFSGRYDVGSGLWNRDMLISHDGSRFLMLKMEDDPPDYRRIQVVLNWFGELQRLVSGR